MSHLKPLLLLGLLKNKQNKKRNLVLPKYDLEEIRRAVVSRILEANEYFKPADSKEESL